ncbi:MAG TPA: small basic protein [Planctomycetaceae bacterium]|nr:small basic protein [Planctomycetaceae bacterium]
MAIDKSLKRKGRLVRSRNVLKREERVNQMKSQETWKDGQSVIGLPKTRVMKISAKKKVKKKEEGDAAGKAAKGAGKAAKK